MGLVALAAVAACSPAPAAEDASLQRDLDLAKGASMELAPQAASETQIVSAIERAPEAIVRPTTSERRPLPRRAPNAPRQEPVPTPSPEADVVAVAEEPSPEVAPTPAPTPSAPAPAADVVPTPRPTPPPAATPSRRGGYKSVGEVIRNAPFPINP